MSDKPKFVNPTTYASLPGQVKVDLLVWMRCFPKQSLPGLACLGLVAALPIVFLVAAPAGAWGIAAFSSVLIAAQGHALWQKATKIKEQFRHGCTNPAWVVYVSPYLIAVYSDLGMREGDSWPVIKIVRMPLEKVRGRRLRVGDRLPTVSLYYGFYSKPHWDDFDPIAVNCVTDDDRVVRDALWRLERRDDEDAWGEMEKCWALVPEPMRHQPGLYWMRQR